MYLFCCWECCKNFKICTNIKCYFNYSMKSERHWNDLNILTGTVCLSVVFFALHYLSCIICNVFAYVICYIFAMFNIFCKFFKPKFGTFQWSTKLYLFFFSFQALQEDTVSVSYSVSCTIFLRQNLPQTLYAHRKFILIAAAVARTKQRRIINV